MITRFDLIRAICDTILDEFKDSLDFTEVRRYLRFSTGVKAGLHYQHIVNTSAFTVTTEKRTVEPGDSLCVRRSYVLYDILDNEEDCPGCLAIARGLAVRDL